MDEDQLQLLPLLPEPRQTKVRTLLSEREAKATDFMDQEYLAIPPTATVGDAKHRILESGLEYHGISYLYVTASGGPLLGVVDARQLLLERDGTSMESVMVNPVVTAEMDDAREDLTAMFSKYHFRMVPVVDSEDHIQGVVRHGDIMKPTAKV